MNYFPSHFSLNFIITRRLIQWLLVAAMMGAGLALAQTEPTLAQVYATAQSGKIDQAQIMIQQVLISHPNSAKAYFVQSELFARQGDLARAREALQTADKLAPGLPFAKAASVQALRAQLGAVRASSNNGTTVTHSVAAADPDKRSSWVLPLMLSVGVIALGYFFFRKKEPDASMPQSGMAPQNSLNGPSTYGPPSAYPNYPNQGTGNMQQPYGQPPYGGGGQPYGQAPGTGLGGRIMGGVATGLAVGAGFMAAEAIGKSLMGGSDHNANTGSSASNYQSVDQNADMGGQGFGVSDGGSWDDGGGIDAGGGDWDN